MDIPFTTYIGGLRQINTAYNMPIMKELFETTFREFDGIDKMHQTLEKQGIRYIVSAAGTQLVTGRRPRRFAGGTNLPTGRYFTVSSSEDFNDAGTLRDEMYGYYSGSSGINPLIFDPKVDRWLTNHLLGNKTFTKEDMEHPFLAFLFKFIKDTEGNKFLNSDHLRRESGSSTLVTYGINQAIYEIANVIDLRIPDTQDWFTQTFVKMEKENEKEAAKRTNIHFIKGDGPKNFGELLPVISSLETGGGNIFGQAVGAWMRTNNVTALIFPTARSTCENVVKNGKITSCKGWNLVMYAGSPLPEEINLFGQMSTWKDPDHDHIKIKYETSGEYKGSFSVRGVKEWNLLKFDYEKFICYNNITDTGIFDITGVINERITRRVNAYLEQQEQNGRLWFNDIDTSDFIGWHEDLWIDKV